MRRLAAAFDPIFSRSFEDCIANTSKCVDEIYNVLKMPPRMVPITAPRVTSSLHMTRNRHAVEVMLRDVYAGNWSFAPKWARGLNLWSNDGASAVPMFASPPTPPPRLSDIMGSQQMSAQQHADSLWPKEWQPKRARAASEVVWQERQAASAASQRQQSTGTVDVPKRHAKTVAAAQNEGYVYDIDARR